MPQNLWVPSSDVILALCCGEQGRPRNAKKALGDLWQKRMMKLMGAEQGTFLVYLHIRKCPDIMKCTRIRCTLPSSACLAHPASRPSAIPFSDPLVRLSCGRQEGVGGQGHVQGGRCPQGQVRAKDRACRLGTGTHTHWTDLDSSQPDTTVSISHSHRACDEFKFNPNHRGSRCPSPSSLD